jgi:putative spermidine/putrescine transport system permease protein
MYTDLLCEKARQGVSVYVIYDSFGIAGNVPFAAAYALVPVAVMAVYLFLAKRVGAFEAL